MQVILSPKKPRPNGTAPAATLGVAYVDSAGLVQAYEVYGTGGC